jgi:hypothetical protein
MSNESLRTLIGYLRRAVSPHGVDGVTDAQLLEQLVGRRDEGPSSC